MPGKFVWYELMTTDVAAAEGFYKHVIGWGARDAKISGLRYTLFSIGTTPVAGLMALPAEAGAAGARPGWNGYVSCDDVDAYAERVKQAGGKIHHGPQDIPDVGRFAMVADPQGAVFALFKGGMDESQMPAQNTPGGVGWHELHAADREKAFAFYAALFGWKKTDAMDMGAMGVYQMFGLGESSMGGMFNKPPAEPAPYWLFYFNVPAIEAAMARVKEKGGQVINGPHQVPGGSWIIQGLDPQGAMFALVAPAK
jgi:predicted enzyme related to lactoylglutathione lyase